MEKTALSPLVGLLDLQPHVEGGWFREMWKSSFEIPKDVLGPRYSGARASASSVYFLLHPGEVSQWHKVLSDELWLYHSGGPLQLTLGGSGDEPREGERIVLGMDVEKGQVPQALVPASVWHNDSMRTTHSSGGSDMTGDSGNVCLVTGGNSGIGLETGRRHGQVLQQAARETYRPDLLRIPDRLNER